MTVLWSEFASKPPYDCELWTSCLNVFSMRAFSFFMGFSLDFYHGDYDLLFYQGQSKWFYDTKYYQKAPTICVESALSIFTYVL